MPKPANRELHGQVHGRVLARVNFDRATFRTITQVLCDQAAVLLVTSYREEHAHVN